MNLPSWLTRQPSQARLDSLAQEIAAASRQAVRLRTEGRCGAMSVSEMRGYVRARAAEPVRRAAAQRNQGLPVLPQSAWTTVVRGATERVVQLVVRELVDVQAAHASYRRAA